MNLSDPEQLLISKQAGASPCDEEMRLQVLASFGLDVLEGDEELARIARFAAKLCGTPMAMVSLVEAERQRFIACEGVVEAETPRSTSICAQAMLGRGIFVVPDALSHPEYADYSYVAGPPHIRFYAGVPLISPEGAPLGTLCVIDIKPHDEGLGEIERAGLEVLAQAVMGKLLAHRRALESVEALERSEARFRQLADSIPDIAWSSGNDGNVDYLNRRWYEFVGTTTRPANGWKSFLHPDDEAIWLDTWENARETGEPFALEHRLLRADGNYRWMLTRGLPIFDTVGQTERWFGTITDVDEGHRLSESRELLAEELAHRIKNIFAVISSLVSLRARGNEDLEKFGKDLSATLRALGQAQGFVRPLDRERSAGLTALLDTLMEPYRRGDGSPIAIEGDAVGVGARAATPLALVFHELATNSAKYGALSTNDGRVSVTVRRNGDDIAIDWRETGGPDVAKPQSQGFGTRLIAMTVRNQLGGTVEQLWEPDGLKVEIILPEQRVRS